jgi:hypothetical protein
LEQRAPADHPLRAVRKLTDAVPGILSPKFDVLYAASGRPPNATGVYSAGAAFAGVLLGSLGEIAGRADQLQLLFRWFVSLGMDDAVWNLVFSKNRDRLLTSDVAQRFFAEANKQAEKFMSDDFKDGSDDNGTGFRG